MVSSLTKKIMMQVFDKHIKEYSENNLYSVCYSKYFVDEFYDTTSICYAFDLLKKGFECDKKYPVPKKLGKDIEKLFNNKDIVVGIYTAYIDKDDLQSLRVSNILNDGIIVTNQLFVVPELTRKVSFPNNIINAMDILKQKSEKTKIDFILTFPSELVNNNGRCNSNAYNEIYDANENGIYIKPDYIDSYVVSNYGMMNRMKKDYAKTLLRK